MKKIGENSDTCFSFRRGGQVKHRKQDVGKKIPTNFVQRNHKEMFSRSTSNYLFFGKHIHKGITSKEINESLGNKLDYRSGTPTL